MATERETDRQAKWLMSVMGVSKGEVLDYGVPLKHMTLSLLTETFTVRDSYQGRGMDYGCFGIIADDFWDVQAEIVQLIDFANTDPDMGDVAEDLRALLKVKPFIDNMAEQKIFYWPNFHEEEQDA